VKNDRTGAAGHWARATKIHLWFDTSTRVARLELARLDASPARETFCNALGALSPKLWCTAGLPLDELAAANSCEAIERCANTPSKRAPFDMRAHFKRERIDEAAIQVMRDAACAQVVNKGDALLHELARKLPGVGACKGRRLGLR